MTEESSTEEISGVAYLRAFRVFLALTLLLSFFKAFRVPDAYARVYYLYSYRFVFVKRALVGTIFDLLFHGCSPQVKNNLIFAVSLLILVVLFVALYVACSQLIEKNKSNYSLHLCLLAFAASPAVVLMVNLTGFLDNLLFIGAVVALGLIRRDSRRDLYLVSGLLLLLMMVHENCLFVCVIPVTFAAIYQGFVIRAEDWRRVAWQLLVLALPCCLLFCFLAMLSGPLTGEAKFRFIEGVLQNRVTYPHENAFLFYPLVTTARANTLYMKELWGNRSWHEIIYPLVVILPTSLLLGWVALRTVCRSVPDRMLRLFIACCCATVVLAPLVLQIVAWDYCRFNAFTSFTAFFALLAVSGSAAFPRDATLLPAGAILALNFMSAVPLYNDYAVKGFPDMFLSIGSELNKLQLPIPYVAPTHLLFPNSDFEQGNLSNWKASGSAFRKQPTYGDNPLTRDKYAVPEGKWWVGSAEDNPVAGPLSGKVDGDEGVGRLVSTEFTLEQDRIGFLVGGGKDAGSTYVALYVDGSELMRASGVDNELMLQTIVDVSVFRGKKAHIEIVDESKMAWGHVNADEFGYVK